MNENTDKIKYIVSVGWVKYVRVGDRIEERYSYDPIDTDYETLEEAMAAYEREDIAQMWRTEKMCAGRAFDNRDFYKSISSFIVDDWGYWEFIETIHEERYGIIQINKEQQEG